MQYERLSGQQGGLLSEPASPTTGLLQAKAADASLPPGLKGVSRGTRGRGGYCFLIVVTGLVAFIYTVYTLFILVPYVLDAEYKKGPIALTILFHLEFLLLVMALIQAVATDAGAVPPHWGFYVGDEARRRRYCRVCNVWKPDRTHHCSQCGRCVLHMDHHCPWINNCVGFYNRKFFIQTLVYANLCLTTVFVHGLIHLGHIAHFYWPNDYNPIYREAPPIEYLNWVLSVVVMLFIALLLAALIPFTKFHWRLLATNSTTIESMDPSFRDQARYDLGTRRNIEQVFGSSTILWWIPFHLYRSRPVGDGVRWRRLYLRASDAAAAAVDEV